MIRSQQSKNSGEEHLMQREQLLQKLRLFMGQKGQCGWGSKQQGRRADRLEN